MVDARAALRLCAHDPLLGGVMLRGNADAREALLRELATALPAGAPLRRVPLAVDEDRLLGGLDLGATLAMGHPVGRAGLLAEAHGGAIVLASVDRLRDGIAGHIAAALDRGEVTLERDSLSHTAPARFVVVALDDAGADDPAPAPALAERLAFWIDCDAASPEAGGGPDQPVAADAAIAALVAAAASLGIAGLRAPLLGLRAAHARARLDGRDSLAASDLAFAARLVLGPRARVAPNRVDLAEDPAPPEPDSGDSAVDPATDGAPQALADRVLAAAHAVVPADLLARIAMQRSARAQRSAQGSGAAARSATRGRPMGARAGVPGGGRRLALVATLRAAAPWQRVRARADRVLIRRDDLRVRRFRQREVVLTLFCVDASGSAAMARLAEAKGAVERLLAQAYVRRAEVALIAFRGVGAELLLPPTRSLTRARRQLADLPGGGGTPIAAGLALARSTALAARARGRTPIVVVLSDGRANIAADGRAVRAAAADDALAEARALAQLAIDTVFIDIGTRPRPEGAALAAALGGRYIALPHARSAELAQAVAR